MGDGRVRPPEPPPSEEDYWRSVLARATGSELDLHRTRRFLERLSRRAHVASLFSDVRLTLERLRSEGRLLGVLTNSGRSEEELRSTLERHGILSFFAAVVSSGSVGSSKPDPSFFRRAVDRLGVAVHEAFYVGDLAYTDAKAARAAGLRSVWLHRDGTGFGDDPPEITSLHELPRFVAQLDGAP